MYAVADRRREDLLRRQLHHGQRHGPQLPRRGQRRTARCRGSVQRAQRRRARPLRSRAARCSRRRRRLQLGRGVERRRRSDAVAQPGQRRRAGRRLRQGQRLLRLPRRLQRRHHAPAAGRRRRATGPSRRFAPQSSGSVGVLALSSDGPYLAAVGKFPKMGGVAVKSVAVFACAPPSCNPAGAPYPAGAASRPVRRGLARQRLVRATDPRRTPGVGLSAARRAGAARRRGRRTVRSWLSCKLRPLLPPQ